MQLNSGLSTQLLLTLFEIKGIVHFGIAGNANSNLQIGDVTIAQYWAHTGLWNWQVEIPPKLKKRKRKRKIDLTDKSYTKLKLLDLWVICVLPGPGTSWYRSSTADSTMLSMYTLALSFKGLTSTRFSLG